MKIVLSYIWNFWCYSVMILIFIISAVIGLLLSFISSNLFSFFTFYLARIITFVLGAKTTIHGNFPITSNESYIYIANHASYLDPVFTTYLIKRKHKYLAKAEILNWPLFGLVVRKYLVAVQRDLKKSRSQSMDLMKKNLLNGFSIVMYPEGGWKDENQKHPYDIEPNKILNEFRNGAFRLSIDSKKKIVPISLSNVHEIHSSDTMMFKPGEVIIKIHNPIDPKDYFLNEEGVRALNQKCYSIIYKDLIKYDTRKKRI